MRAGPSAGGAVRLSLSGAVRGPTVLDAADGAARLSRCSPQPEVRIGSFFVSLLGIWRKMAGRGSSNSPITSRVWSRIGRARQAWFLMSIWPPLRRFRGFARQGLGAQRDEATSAWRNALVCNRLRPDVRRQIDKYGAPPAASRKVEARPGTGIVVVGSVSCGRRKAKAPVQRTNQNCP